MIRMTNTATAIIVASILLLSGCLGWAATEVAVQSDASGQPVLSQAVTLADAVGIALTNNPTIAGRRALLTQAAARVGMARAMTRPQVSTTTFGTTGSVPMILTGSPGVQPFNINMAPDKGRINQNFMGMLPLYTGGALQGRVNTAKGLQEASSLDVATSELDVAYAVKAAYYQVRLAQSYVDVWQSRVTEARERVRIAEEAFAAGRIARYDLLRNQTDQAEAEQQLNNAQRDVDTGLIDLKNMMGLSQTSQLTLSQAFTAPETVSALEELQATAIRQRPEVAAARARIRSAQASLTVAKSAYKPQIYGTAMADLSATSGEGGDAGYLVGVTASLPILDGGLRRSQVDEAQGMIAQMQADERETILGVSRGVASAYTQLTTAAANVSLAQAAVTSAEEDYRIIQMRYEAGRAINVEVLDALAALTRARTMYAEALYGYNVAREALTRAIGQR